jgi:hypothetical protein
MSRRDQTLVLGTLLGLSALPAACISIAPIQAARNVQVEAYRGDFTLTDRANAEATFREILGDRNIDELDLPEDVVSDGGASPDTLPVVPRWRAGLRHGVPLARLVTPTKATSKWEPYLLRAQSGRFKVTGQFVLSVSLYPWDNRNARRSFVEGVGHYVVVDEDKESPDGGQNEEFVASADFYIVDSRPSEIRRLNTLSGDDLYFDAIIRQHVVREFQPDKKRYVHESTLINRIYLTRIEEDIYVIDYCGYHDLGVIRKKDSKVLWSGCIWFDRPPDGRKLIDMRQQNSGLIYDDYAPKLERKGFVQERGFVPGENKGSYFWTPGKDPEPTCHKRQPPPELCRRMPSVKK